MTESVTCVDSEPFKTKPSLRLSIYLRWMLTRRRIERAGRSGVHGLDSSANGPSSGARGKSWWKKSKLALLCGIHGNKQGNMLTLNLHHLSFLTRGEASVYESPRSWVCWMKPCQARCLEITRMPVHAHHTTGLRSGRAPRRNRNTTRSVSLDLFTLIAGPFISFLFLRDFTQFLDSAEELRAASNSAFPYQICTITLLAKDHLTATWRKRGSEEHGNLNKT
ncbi:hypothetical protein FB451DRAFT_308330 [Mycena latifolia]|nr:hypothetical protein FB451DRAFT_308330 [Mycena latifolia]